MGRCRYMTVVEVTNTNKFYMKGHHVVCHSPSCSDNAFKTQDPSKKMRVTNIDESQAREYCTQDGFKRGMFGDKKCRHYAG